jgi:hypothetical protein
VPGPQESMSRLASLMCPGPQESMSGQMLASAESGNMVAMASGNVAAMTLDDDFVRHVDDAKATFVRGDATGNTSG